MAEKQVKADIDKKKAFMQAKIERDLFLRNDKETRKKKLQDEKMEEANNMIRHSQDAMAASLQANGGRFSIRNDPTNTIKNSVSLEKVSIFIFFNFKKMSLTSF